MTADEQPMFARPVTEPMPDSDRTHRHIKEICFLDADDNPVDITAAKAPAAGSVNNAALADNAVTPAKVSGYTSDKHGAFPRVKADGSGFDFIMPSSIGNNLLTAASTTVARTNVGVPTATVQSEAVAAVKAKSQIAALKTLATDADVATTVQTVNQIIAALQA